MPVSPRRSTLAGLTLLGVLAAGASTAGAQGVLREDWATAARAAAAARAAERVALRDTTAAPFAALSASARTLRDSLVALARAQIGTRYRTGGASPERGFDCSGFVQFVLAAFDLHLPRTAARQARIGEPVARDTAQLRPGDLLTFGSASRIDHIGIYVGDGRFVHASSVAGRVIESRVDRPLARLVKPWRGARRLAIAGDTIPAPVQESLSGRN